ncbi:MAG: Asp-tRNA(Asn)/Glu-tRNA(Gln) amidotransferase subunit GatB [Candidatus Eisenbacteria bacterium]|nr:Asp-tRNA(Asn)/Glu-tRNA(Gln) amidotransferase subunit GatB [Candidatus Eisenbacteria bacterium]
MKGFESVIGLEIHAQLLTRSKLFCGCGTGFGAEPNTQVCPVCLGLPGALPVLNRRAVELAVLVGEALHAHTNTSSVFARKNYFYPDLPKNYQISQFDRPLCSGGHLYVSDGGKRRRVRVTRVHLEEDAGKSVHLDDAGGRRTLVDFNRCGVPLIEIVTEPELRSPSEAHALLKALKQILEYTGASSGNMEEGGLRCDVNVSLRRVGERALGSKTEIKNLNSFRNVERALEYEIERQAGLLAGGTAVLNETLMWDAGRDRAVSMRSKEEAHDYRYFPEPDLLRLELKGDWIDDVKSRLPELPEARESRFVESLGLPPYDAAVLCGRRALADYFEEVARLTGEPKSASNWIMTEVLRTAKEGATDEFPVTAANLADLLTLVRSGRISGKMAKDVFARMAGTGETADDAVSRMGLRQVTDVREMRTIVDAVLSENPKSVADYARGKKKLFGFLMGRIMEKTAGQASPTLAESVLRERLEGVREGDANT